jgi:hypothetical protein
MKNLNEINREELEVELSKTGIDFTRQDIDLMIEGKYSTLKENLNLADGSVKDGKIKLTIDEEGKIKFNYKFKVNEIEIPRSIGAKKFSEEEINNLIGGKAVQFNYNGDLMFLQVDKELNAITIKTAAEINLTEVAEFKMGGYVFDDKQKMSLDKGELINGVVMKGEMGWFVTSMRQTDDKKGFVYENYKEISKEQAEELLKDRYKDNKIDNIISATLDKEKSIEKDSAVINTASVTGPTKDENTKEISITAPEDKLKEYEEKIYTAVRNNDFKEINILAQNKPEISKEFLNRLEADTNVKPHDKVAVKTILGINVKEELKKTSEKDQEAKVVIEKDNKQQQGKPTGVKRKIAKDITNTAFGDM